jgi:serine phosphatase RsbU (regulator of sigma subunit)/anti-sigma regulatory factor (Ser/Thr protein kinase)
VDRSIDRALAELHRVTDAALAYLSLDDLVRELLDRIAEVLEADTVTILLLDEERSVLRVRASKGIARDLGNVEVPLGHGFSGRVAAERRAIAIDDVEHTEIVNPALLRATGIRSLLGVPMLVEGRVTGVLHVGSLTPRTFDEAETALLQVAGDRAALALEHARLFHHERDARTAAESLARRMSAVQRVTDAALAYLSLDDLLRELLDRIADLLGSDTAAILLLVEERQVLRARAAKGIEEEVEQGVEIPLGMGFAGRIAADKRPLAIPDVDHADILNPILREKGIRSLLGVPLLIGGRVIGVLHVGSLTAREFTAEDDELLQVAGDRAALAIENAQLFEQRRVTESVQRVLLPEQLPDIPGLEFTARYRPAVVAELVGGDWYDVFQLESGRVGLVIGDVVGKGVAAAALMAQMRIALRAYALEGHSPASVLARMNRLLDGFEGPRMTTVGFLVLDPEDETLVVASAGHVPPLRITAEGEAGFLDVQGDPPLGVTRGAVYSEHRFDLPVGASVVLVSDGAIEVPGEALDAGLERLRALGERVPAGAALCDAIAHGEAGSPERDDDIAVLAARLEPLPDTLATSWPATAEALAPLRHLLRRWLLKWGATPDEAFDITVAVQEACANAVEHAYAPGPAAFELSAVHSDGLVTATVRDRGHWRDPRGANRGRGLPMMEALMDSVQVDRDQRGTTITLQRALRGRSLAA